MTRDVRDCQRWSEVVGGCERLSKMSEAVRGCQRLSEVVRD